MKNLESIWAVSDIWYQKEYRDIFVAKKASKEVAYQLYFIENYFLISMSFTRKVQADILINR